MLLKSVLSRFVKACSFGVLITRFSVTSIYPVFLIFQLCRQSGHSWKAAIFEGWRLYHDPSRDKDNLPDPEVADAMEVPTQEDEPKEIEGNASRDIWKTIAIKYCKQVFLLKTLPLEMEYGN